VEPPGMPEGSTVSMDNAQQSPEEGIPQEMQSPLTMGLKGGGVNLLYLARRAATAIQEAAAQGGEAKKFTMLNTMKMSNPQLYMLVLRIINSEQGSQANPLDAMQSPLPIQKPERRASPVGM
jgi:hypothetical protein